MSTKLNGINVQLNGLSSDIPLPSLWSSNAILRWLPSESYEPDLKLVICAGSDVMLCGINAMEGGAEFLATYTREEWDPVAGTFLPPISILCSLIEHRHVEANSK